jgi:hypothetical protein
MFRQQLLAFQPLEQEQFGIQELLFCFIEPFPTAQRNKMELQ